MFSRNFVCILLLVSSNVYFPSNTFKLGNMSLSGEQKEGAAGGSEEVHVNPKYLDTKYVEYLESKLALSQAKNAQSDFELQTINARLSRLELGSHSPMWGDSREVLDFNLRRPGEPATPQPPVLHKQVPDMSLPKPTSGFASSRSIPITTTGVHHAPAEVLNGPLTQVLAEISEAINPGPIGYKQGIRYRPEYYVQHLIDCKPIKSLDHSKMSYKDLFYGMTQVLINISKSGGDADAYLDHMAFVSKQAQLNSFNDAALVSYDRAVVDKVVRGDLPAFVAADTVSAACSFHAGNIQAPPVRRDHTGRKGRGYFKKYRGDQAGGESADRDTAPQEPFPPELCYAFNYRKCAGSCGKLHLCRVCRGTHRGLGCSAKA